VNSVGRKLIMTTKGDIKYIRDKIVESVEDRRAGIPTNIMYKLVVLDTLDYILDELYYIKKKEVYESSCKGEKEGHD
jgi:hypothetical protein